MHSSCDCKLKEGADQLKPISQLHESPIMRDVGADVWKQEGTYSFGNRSRPSLSCTYRSTRSRLQTSVFQRPTSYRRTPDTWDSGISGLRPPERKHDGGYELTALAVKCGPQSASVVSSVTQQTNAHLLCLSMNIETTHVCVHVHEQFERACKSLFLVGVNANDFLELAQVLPADYETVGEFCLFSTRAHQGVYAQHINPVCASDTYCKVSLARSTISRLGCVPLSKCAEV